VSTGCWLGLDIGTRRIGVALARTDIRLSHPLTTLENNDSVLDAIKRLVDEHEVQRVIVGLPRGMNGQDTDQTKYTEEFAEQLEIKLGMSVVRQDEALTSQKAEAELTARKKPFAKGEVDALAATYILEDYINEHVGASYV
jgi:putative Holliday junction resolvase